MTTTLDMTGRLGSSLRGTELIERYRGDVNPANGKRHGKGAYAFPNPFFTYEGDFVDGAKHGAGRLSMADGGWYEGDFVHDEITGRGVRAWADGRRYEGEFRLGEMHGAGKHVGANGDVYEGTMAGNSREGRGVLTLANGDAYEGEFRRNVPNGRGKQRLAANGESYDGDFVDGSRHGHGVMTAPGGAGGGAAYEGAWADDVMHGPGKGRDAESGVTYEGEYAHGKPLAIPSTMEVASGKDVEEGTEAATVGVGTAAAPVAVVAGQAIPSGAVKVIVRLPWVPPVTAKEGDEHGDAAAEDDGTDGADGGNIGETATHESGRWLRCSLHVGVPEQPPPPEGGEEPGSGSPVPSVVYGEEVPLAGPPSVDTLFTAAGEAAVENVAVAATTAPGTYTLRIVDVTPGAYGALGRCGELSVVLDVQPPPTPAEGEEEGAATGGG